MIEDAELLRRYAEERSDAAFAELVSRHVGLVYAAALRQLGGAAHRAQDVTQAVFVALAGQAGPLAQRTEIVGWLYTTTHHVAAKLKRTEQRRAQREQEAHAMNEILADDNAATADWERLRPVLDEAMLGLGAADREAILLRYFQDRRFAEVGQRLGLSEDAARRRVERALDQLQVALGRHGITSTTAALGVALANPALATAPAGLAATVTGAVLTTLAAGAGAGGALGTATIFMNAKITVAAAVAVLAVGFSIYQFKVRRDEGEAAARAQVQLQARLRTAQQRVAAAEQQSAAAQREAAAAQAAKPVIPTPTGAASGAATMTPAEAPDSPRMVLGAGTRIDARAQQAALTDSTYAALYRSQGWTEAQQNQFRDLMFERQQSYMLLGRTAVLAARAKNPNFGRADQLEIMEAAQSQSQIEGEMEMRRLMGDAAAAALEHYDTTLAMRSVANQLATALFSMAEPLSQPQAEQLIEILSAHSRGISGRTEIPALNIDAAVNAAQGLLTPTQLVQLRKVAVMAQEQNQRDRERNTAPVVFRGAPGK